MIHVLAIITTKPGKRDEVLAAFRANMPLVTEFSIKHKFVATADEIPMAWGTKAEQPAALLRFDTSIVR